jgi:hypothetical protein
MALFGKWLEREKGPEKIRGAVIRYDGGNVLGENHQDSYDKIVARNPGVPYDFTKEEARGWLTTKGRIVSTQEAYEIKLKSGQISPDESPPRSNE